MSISILAGKSQMSKFPEQLAVSVSSILSHLNNIEIPAAILDNGKNIYAVNSCFCLSLLIDETKISGTHIRELIPSLQKWSSTDAYKTKPFNSKTTIELHSGHKISCSINVEPISNKNEIFFLITFREIADNKELRKHPIHQPHLDAIISIMPDAALITQNNLIITANRVAANLFGVSNEKELIGREMHSLISPEDDIILKLNLRTGERVAYKTDGSLCVVEVFEKSLSFSEIEITLIILKDVTTGKEPLCSHPRKCSLIEQSQEFGGILNTKGQFSYINPALLSFTGYESKDLLSKGFVTLFANYQSDKSVLEIWDNLEKGIPYSGTVLCKKRSGELFYHESTLNPLKDANGALIGYIISGRDVTSRILFEQESSQHEKRFRLIVEHVSDIIFLLLGDGTIEYVSPAVLSSLSFLPADLAGKEFTSLVKDDSRKSVNDILIKSASGETKDFSFDVIMIDKTRHSKTFEAVGKMFSEKDNINKFIVVCRNIDQQKILLDELHQYKDNLETLVSDRTSQLLTTNEKLNNEISWRKEVEEELSVKDERLALALEVSAYGLWDINFETGSIFYNERFSDILEFSGDKKEIMDLKSFESFIHPDDIHLFRDKFKNHLMGKSEVFEIEHRLVLKNYVRKYVSLRGKVVLKDSDGNASRFIGRIEDISMRRKVEEKLQKALEREKELNEMKSRFISIVSHEYRTPLATILSSAEILELYDEQLSPEKKSEQLSKIESCVDEMTQLLDDVITINKYDMEKIDHTITEFEIISFSRSIIHDAISIMKVAPHIHFGSNLNEFKINSSLTLYKQILSNLVTNACKYTPSSKSITITISISASHVSIKVEDQGIGISPDDQKHLFEPFFRGSNVGSLSGSGLGLSIVKRSVDILQGTLSMESTLHIGTTFTIELPSDYNINSRGV